MFSLLLLSLLACSGLESSAQAESIDAGASSERGVDSAAVGVDDTGPVAEADLESLDDTTLERALLESPSKIGSLSLGPTDGGAMVFPVRMPEGERWSLVKAQQSWSTQETIDFIITAIDEVHRQFPETPPLYIGDISKKRGGYFPPHVNHQNGRDVDLGFYYLDPTTPWYKTAYRSNLDVPRTWALIKALVTQTDLERIYVDRFVISLVKAQARARGEDEVWLKRIFEDPSPTYNRPLIRHENGHRTHMHVQFHNPKAQRLGQRLLPLLEKHALLRHPLVFTDHLVKQGETLERLVRRYRTTKHGVRQFNVMTNDALVVGKTYSIPHEGRIEVSGQPIVIPPRILPPRPHEIIPRTTPARPTPRLGP